MVSKLTAIFFIFSLLFIPQDLSVLAQNECIGDSCIATPNNKIFNNYSPDIPSMHKISLLSGQIIPDVHYVNKNNKEKIFLFRNHFQDFKNLLYKTLETKLNESYLYYIDKDDFLKMANVTYEGPQNTLWEGIKYFIRSFNNGEIIKLISLNRILHRLNHRYGHKQLCGLNIDKDSVTDIDADFFDLKRGVYFCFKDKFNAETMEEISSIIESNNTVKSKISDLNNLIDEKYDEYRKFKNEDTSYDTISFCLHLNRINDYLSNFEKDWNHKDLDECKEIRKLREKINSLIPNYCFLTEKNKAPFAGVKIDKYILVTDTNDVKRIYLENSQVPKFVENLIKSIDSKYSNIKGTYSFGLVKGEDVLKLASEVHSTNHQDLINALERKAEEAEALRKRKLASIGFDIIETGIKLATKGDLFEFAKKNGGGFKISPEEAYQYLEAKKPDLIKNLPAPTSATASVPQETPSSRSLEQNIEGLNLDKAQMSKLELELGKIIEYSLVATNAKREKNKVDALKKELESNNDYLNSVKLLTQFSKFNYLNTNNYDAIIIEENKQYETSDAENKNFREYNIIAMQKMEDK